jgi:hypothetical protein
MELLAVLLALSCPKTEVINNTSKWDGIDQETLQYASKRCKIYYEDAPCLKKFVKREERAYWAICGAR